MGQRTFALGILACSVLLLATFLALPISRAAGSLAGVKVCLDPGHGGTDPGAVNGILWESDINLDVSYALKSLLEGEGAEVIMTRYEDVYRSNRDRYTFCDGEQATILVSVHTNSVTDPSWDGSMGLYFHDDDRALAQAIHDVVYPALRDTAPEPGIFADSDQVNMANQATDFREAYKATAAIDSTAFSPGSDDSTSIRIAYDRVNADHWALWGIVLPETDVSSLKLAFDIKGQVGDERPNVWLVSSGSPSEIRNVVDIEDYVTVTTNWQRAEIPLTDFRDPWGQQQPIDLTQILRVEIAFEWGDMAGMVYVDGFAFEP